MRMAEEIDGRKVTVAVIFFGIFIFIAVKYYPVIFPVIILMISLLALNLLYMYIRDNLDIPPRDTVSVANLLQYISFYVSSLCVIIYGHNIYRYYIFCAIFICLFIIGVTFDSKTIDDHLDYSKTVKKNRKEVYVVSLVVRYGCDIRVFGLFIF